MTDLTMADVIREQGEARDFLYEELNVDQRINLKGNFEWFVSMDEEQPYDSPLMSGDGMSTLYFGFASEGEATKAWNEYHTENAYNDIMGIF